VAIADIETRDAGDCAPPGTPFRSPIRVGFLGSYTTFSTWSLVSCRLIEDGAHLLAVANLVDSLMSA
jgi:fluoride ion exporter CrcB/FEX